MTTDTHIHKQDHHIAILLVHQYLSRNKEQYIGVQIDKTLINMDTDQTDIKTPPDHSEASRLQTECDPPPPAPLTEVESDFDLPDPPEEPLPSDCCGTGCVPCVLDIYQEELEKWLKLKAMSPQERAEWRCVQKQKKDKEAVVRKVALSLAQYKVFTLEQIEQLTRDTILFTFSLPPDCTLGLQVGQHVLLRVPKADGSYLTRQYTPVNPLNQTGSFSVLIKVYENGEMSQHVSKWRVGDAAAWRGPFGGFQYSTNKYSNIGMLACGTGITPMLQVIREVVENEEEETFIHLVYGCRTQEDILLKKELDHYTTFWNFTVLYALSRTDTASLAASPGVIKYGDKVHFGRIDANLVCKEMPDHERNRNTLILVCGTDQFNEDMLQYLSTAGYPKDTCFKF